MSTVVAAVMRRSYTAGMFDDLFGGGPVVPHVRVWDKASGVTTLTFTEDLDPAIEQAIRCRMASRDDADQAERAALRAAHDAVLADPTLHNVAALVTLTANYVLGEA